MTRRPGGTVSANIVVVDNDEPTRRALERFLTGAGYMTRFVDAHAISSMEAPPDLVLLDIDSDLQHFDTCRELKRAGVPVLFLLPSAATGYRARVFVHAADYLLKPLMEHEVLTRIRSTLRTHETDAAADVLVVDDAPANLHLLGEVLRVDGHTVRPVLSGEKALSVARRRPPDVILVDVNMPGMDGYELCAQLKADPILRDIPVIFVSGRSESLDKVKAFEAGGVDYILKPIDAAEVRARVSTHVRIRRLRGRLETQASELRRNLQRLEQLEQMRDDLTHMLVHDLRAPISAMLNFLYLLRGEIEEHVSEDVLQDLMHLQWSADKMARMVDDILDVSRMEEAGVPISFAEHDCRDLVAKAANTLAVSRKVEKVLPDEPVIVRTDPDMLRRVVANLLDNALKVTPASERVRVIVEPAADAVRVGVEDRGPGIAEEQRTTIFRKFQTNSSNGTRRSSGLGLAFCKMAMEALGGSIDIESNAGVGSTFWIKHPW